MVAGLGASGEKGKTFKKPLKQRRRGNRDHSRKKILLSDEGKMIEKEDEEGFGLLGPQPTMQEAQVTSENGRRRRKKRKISGPQGAPPAPLLLLLCTIRWIYGYIDRQRRRRRQTRRRSVTLHSLLFSFPFFSPRALFPSFHLSLPF